MKSVLYFVAIAALLAVVSVSGAKELVKDPVKEEDSEELNFTWIGMDKETVERGLREVRDANPRASSILVEKPAIVPFGRMQASRRNAWSYVWKNMDKDMGNWILYPYNFTYIEPPEASSVATTSSSTSSSVFKQGNMTLPDGAMLTTMSTENFPVHSMFTWIESKTDMNLQKAKVVYDMNIAVLLVEATSKGEDGEDVNIDITYDSDYFCSAFTSGISGKYARCFVGMSGYEDYIKGKTDSELNRPIFVFLTPADIANNSLKTKTGENRFGMLMIPDLRMDEVSYVKKIMEAHKSKIQNFISAGGLLYTTGKGAYLTESWGLVPASTFDPRFTLISPKSSVQYNDGCDMVGNTEPADDSEEEFRRSTLCFSLGRWGNNILNGLNSAVLLKQPETSHQMKKLLFWRSISKNQRMVKHDEQTGIDSDLDEEVKRVYPSVMYKTYGKGHVIVNTGNPIVSSETYEHLFNAFLLAGSRPIALDNELTGDFNRTVPALEQVDLGIKLNVVNYFPSDITGAKLFVFTVNGTEVTAPSGCSVANSSEIPSKPSDVLVGKVYKCEFNSEKFTKRQYAFKVRIVDPLVTQQKKDCVVLWPVLKYTDPNRNNQAVTVSYGIKIQAAASALLRADMNIDPSSAYPLHATGTFIDNVMNCENKEETYAYRVQQVSIVPVISPLIDILDQVRLTTALFLDKDYYQQATNKIGLWKFPFPHEGKDNRTYDFLDWDLLYERSDLLCADWDEGVKIDRIARSEFNIPPARGDFVPRDVIMNADYQTNNDDDTFLLKQFWFDDADKFYEHAVQRLMAFLDVSTVEGAKTYWGGNIPDEWKSASNPEAGKRHVLFVRHDIFWWKKYLMPYGLTNDQRDTFISLDKYEHNVGCGGKDARSYAGAFNNDDGLIPAEYPSKMELFNYTETTCRKRLDLDKIESLTNGKIKAVHYIVPIHPGDGTKAGDFYGFDTKTGRNLVYEDVQFIYTFGLNVDIYPEVSRRGGEIVFKFKDDDLPWDDLSDAVSKDYITVGADQIAVYKIYATSKNELRIRFKRGQMPNEAYGQASHLQIFFEGTKWVTNGDLSPSHLVSMDVYDMQYDISLRDSNFENWSHKTVSGAVQNFTVKAAFKLPALRLQFAINDDLEKSYMNPYELREPLVRYGIYEQELIAHRAVHGSAEFHPEAEPCIVTRNGGFSTFTHVGTSSVPFREYVNTGTSLQIPAATETGRVEWDDIWGRHFVQNVRSTIFEYPPIPPPLRNFVMTTTFEILDKNGKRMLGGWRSNEDVDVHVQMKLLNNYPKWFEITSCLENRVPEDCTQARSASGGQRAITCTKSRVYDTDNNFVHPTGIDDGTMYFKTGHKASYGICLSDGTVRMEGRTLTEEEKKGVMAMTLCAKTFGSDNHTCEDAYPGLPVLKRAPENSEINGSQWNFATRVIDYWPDNYIKENMWDLTHYDYDDNQFDKAYKYHMDNNLPHLGLAYTRPDNLISFPLYKGLGYTMVYNETFSNPRFGSDHKGWWSDNLQNKDNTLVAGNKVSNDVSVGQKPLIPDEDWFDISKVQNGESKVKAAETNVYSCLFNRRNPKHYMSSTKVSWLTNVYENNIVPVPPKFNDKMENHFQCTRDEWYSPLNISQYPNIVYTDTARDWLYFGANLRGGAREDINVLYHLSPLENKEILFEGTAKVQDGGRFVYWNPANSKNSYLVVDNPVHVVLAKRNDIELEQEIIPTYTTTFDSVVFHHLTVSDPEEIEREWELPIYTNNYGYGDFTVQVYVGDAGTTAVPTISNRDVIIRARITFMNNAGFDINMKKDAINSTLIGQEAINADDLMKNIVHALRAPDSYNFLEFEIPEDLKPYVKIVPCQSVVGIAPLFFDFEAINVVTIRDGWKGDYYVNITISKDFPESKRGRLNEIPVKLVRKYFDQLPGVGDVTGAHDYTVEVPSLVFGVPYSSKNKLWGGKVFYTSGYASKVDLRANVAKPFVPGEAILISEEDLDAYRDCLTFNENDITNVSTAEGEFACLDRVWNKDLKNHTKCGYNVAQETSSSTVISFTPCMEANAPTFPVKVDPTKGPDQAVMHILMRTRAERVTAGHPVATNSITCKYNDWTNKSVEAEKVPYMTVHSKGAWMKLSWSVSLLASSGLYLDEPLISPNNSGLAQVNVTIKNAGDFYAYNVMFNLTLDENVTVATENDTDTAGGSPVPEGCGVGSVNGSTTFWCYVADKVVPSQQMTFPFRVYYNPDKREGAGPSAKAPLNMRLLAAKSSASIDLTSSLGEKRVTQELEGPIGITYTKKTDENMVVLSGRRGTGYGLTLSATHKLSNIRVYIWRARLPKSPYWTTIAVTNASACRVSDSGVTTCEIRDDVFDRFLALGGDKDDVVKVDYLVAVSRSKSNVTVNNSGEVSVLTQSNVYEWRVSSSNLLLLLLLLPGLAIPAAAAAAIFATTKGVNKEPVRELGMAQKQKFVPQELVDDEPVPLAETDTTRPPPPMPQRATPTYEPPEPAPQVATSGRNYAIPTGPTYLRAGVPVNVVDN